MMHGRRKEEEAEMGIARATHLAQPVGRKGLAAAACGLALAGRAGNRRGEDDARSIAPPRNVGGEGGAAWGRDGSKGLGGEGEGERGRERERERERRTTDILDGSLS